MTTTVDFLFDFGSPNAYLAHKVVPAIEGRVHQKFVYRPILLGGLFKLTGNQSPIAAFAGIKNKLAYERLEMERFVAHHCLEAFRNNPHFPVNTLHVMRGAIAARDLGVFDAYVDTIFAAMWEKQRKLDNPAVIKDTLAEAGLPADAIIAKTQEQPVKDALLAETQAACERGAFGSPTFFVDDQMFFGKERLPAVETEFLRRSRG